MVRPLAEILEEAAHGRFPPADGAVLITGPPPGPCRAVVAFTGSHVIASEAPEAEVRARLDPADLGAPTSVGFLQWLGTRIGRRPGSLDLVLAAPSTGDDPTAVPVEDPGHPRVVRALRYRTGVAVYRDGPGTIITGLGLAGRFEVSIDLEREQRGRGRGAALARTARRLAPAGTPVFAQTAPGNAASVRAFLSAGFRPIGAEILYPPG
jgi:hypothetical protein